MAWVEGRISVSFQFQDDDLAQASSSVQFGEGTTLAEAEAYAADYVALVGAVSDCALQKYTISREMYDDTFPQGAAGSDVEDKGVLQLRTVGNSIKTFSWPGVLESVLLNTITPPGTFINLANAAVAALVAAIVTGLDGVAPTNSHGDDLLSVVQAFKKNTASIKSRQYKG